MDDFPYFPFASARDRDQNATNRAYEHSKDSKLPAAERRRLTKVLEETKNEPEWCPHPA
jgi:hypothetical protein